MGTVRMLVAGEQGLIVEFGSASGQELLASDMVRKAFLGM
jgi:hypothetical protein